MDVRSDSGFSMVELLVVTMIIGILAAITLPVFMSQRRTAWEAVAVSGVRTAHLAAESCNTSNNGLADCTTVAQLNGFGYAEDPDVDLDYMVAANSYTISGQHVLGGDRFSVSLGAQIIRSDRLP